MTCPWKVRMRCNEFFDDANRSVLAAVANIEEFMTMIAGGLAGASPHMISATITAISRLIFEFKGKRV